MLTSFECKAAVFLGWSKEGWETGCEIGQRRTSEETHGNSVMAVLGPCVRRLGEKKPILIRFKVFGDHTDIFQSPLK